MGAPINRLESIFPKSMTAEPPIGSAQATWDDTAKSWERKLESFLADHPKAAIATATAVGLLLGWLVKRK
jgi:ElaB/YqjD/DUF883 family membrane-anchored ribosome-binding protein